MSYSQISFEDIRTKLNLGDMDVGLIVAKALKDKVITGEINSSEAILIIKENKNIYSTNEPLVNYQKRINYCLNLHDAAVKALMYPQEKETKKTPEDDEGTLEEQFLAAWDGDFF
jgi:26S proteasome regulatory subunit N3